MKSDYVAGVIGTQFASRSGSGRAELADDLGFARAELADEQATRGRAELTGDLGFARAELADGQATRGRAELIGETDIRGVARVRSNSIDRPQAGMERAQRPLPYRSTSSTASHPQHRYNRQSAHRDAKPRDQNTSSRRSNQKFDRTPRRSSPASGQRGMEGDKSEFEDLRANPTQSQHRTDHRTSHKSHWATSDHTQRQQRKT